jgi:hypothetical protein
MGCPQLGFPRLRLAAERATSIAIGRSYSLLGDCGAVLARMAHGLRERERGDIFGQMAVSVEMHNTGDPEVQRDVVAIVEHVLSDRPGDWCVSTIGSQDSDQWELKIFGPNGFERSYTLWRDLRDSMILM